jgi:hypothetical protein
MNNKDKIAILVVKLQHLLGKHKLKDSNDLTEESASYHKTKNNHYMTRYLKKNKVKK